MPTAVDLLQAAKKVTAMLTITTLTIKNKEIFSINHKIF